MTRHLKLVPHEHQWEGYVLIDDGEIYYTGYKCSVPGCGTVGYKVPRMPQDQPGVRGVLTAPAGVADTVGGDGVPPRDPPTTEEWQEHLDEEHEFDERNREDRP